MSERLYYEDATIQEFAAHVVERWQTERGFAVRLDRTAFYPTSGGQPHDTGTLNGVPVTDVWEEDGVVWHLLSGALEADEVTGRIDWPRRFDHMQQHSGQHVLSEAFVRVMDAHTIAVHIGSETNTVDLKIPKLDWEAVFRVEDEVNRVVWENRPVTAEGVSEDALAGIPLRRPPKVSGAIRIVWVADYDASACGGTHVRYTGEIGLVKITGFERYKGGVRVSFLCGGRAAQDYRRALGALQAVSAALSTNQDDLTEVAVRLQEDLKSVRRELNHARDALTQVEAERLWADTPEVDGVRRIVAHWADRSFADARAMATQLRARPGTLVLIAATEEKGLRLVCARSDDLAGVDASAILRQAAEALGGRGGGSPEMAQGGAKPQAHEVVMAALMAACQTYPPPASLP